jgi:hypothetical protein
MKKRNADIARVHAVTMKFTRDEFKMLIAAGGDQQRLGTWAREQLLEHVRQAPIEEYLACEWAAMRAFIRTALGNAYAETDIRPLILAAEQSKDEGVRELRALLSRMPSIVAGVTR